LQDFTPLVSPELADEGWIFTALKVMIEHMKMKARLGSGVRPRLFAAAIWQQGLPI